jgi:hypothetical protein
MNIKDLPQGSYQVADQPLNINNLPQPTTPIGPADSGTPAQPNQFEGVMNGINNVIGAVQNHGPLNWLSKLGGAAVGAAGGLIGGAVGAVGTPITNAIQNKPLFQGLGKNIVDTVSKTANAGFEMGSGGVKAAPFGALGKIPSAIVAAPQLYEGVKDLATGKYEDSILPLITGLATAYGVVKVPGMWVNGDLIAGAGKISSGVNPKGNYNRALNMLKTTPEDITKGKRIQAVTSFQAEPGGTFKAANLQTKDQATQLASKYAPLFDSSNPITVINNFGKAIKTADETVGVALEKHPITFTPKEMETYLIDKMKPTIRTMMEDPTIVNPSAAPKFVVNLVKKFVANVPGEKTVIELPGATMSTPKVSGYNLKNAWTTRKDFDQYIKTQLNAFGGGKGLKVTLATDFRNGVQDFIQSKLSTLPKGAVPYMALMDEMRNMYNAVRLIAPKAERIMGTTGLERLIEKTMAPIASPVGKVIRKAIIKR